MIFSFLYSLLENSTIINSSKKSTIFVFDSLGQKQKIKANKKFLCGGPREIYYNTCIWFITMDLMAFYSSFQFKDRIRIQINDLNFLVLDSEHCLPNRQIHEVP